ncbi:hypothetical protein CAPTEDRAFT_186696 [Capitella teleta]|uniref:Uncharacterized protein n=1 Tax=Capitella teleta TaxID=283909 RepID=R7TQ06_CAPTE|nr:hypothetical protein CAPTEDRAFT_186696 [Capitella teleta]|eukprot:ELT95973.1 hypothetical protein CAPTEDRAFT_186696 [Capitella teleta]
MASNGSPHRVPSEPIWCGVGSGKPQSREKFGGMFGHVADAFDEKTLPVGQTDYRGRSTNKEEETEEVNEEEEEKKEEEEGEKAEEEVDAGVRTGPFPVSEAVQV